MKSKSLSNATLARQAGISGAAVTKWFRQGQKTGWVNVETNTLRHLAENLQVPLASFLEEPTDLSSLRTRFLWDHLYPDMEDFTKAVAERREPALARLVQVLGFRAASAIAGQVIVKKFNQYKHLIKPVRRRELETLWPLYWAR